MIRKLFICTETLNELTTYENFRHEIVVRTTQKNCETRTCIILSKQEARELIMELEVLIDKIDNNG